MKVIVCLHAVQGSQNGHDHSAPRDGHVEWGDSQIPDTVAVIDFLAARFLILGCFLILIKDIKNSDKNNDIYILIND